MVTTRSQLNNNNRFEALAEPEEGTELPIEDFTNNLVVRQVLRTEQTAAESTSLSSSSSSSDSNSTAVSHTTGHVKMTKTNYVSTKAANT